MKSSLVMPSRFHSSWKCTTVASACCCGVMPALSAARCTFWPCSSVPVRKYDGIARQPVVARQHIGQHGGVGMADVGLVVDVVDRGGDVERGTRSWYPRKVGIIGTQP
jgi:hypothetical protein